MPDMQRHEQFLERIDGQLQEMDFNKSIPMGYHDIMPKETVELLKSRYDSTSLYLRGRTDRISIHKKKALTLIWDGKLHESKKYHDCCIEFYQFRTYFVLSDCCEVRFLYIYYTPFGEDKIIKSFEPDNIKIREVKVPNRYEKRYDSIRSSVKKHLHIDDEIVNQCKNSPYGSNDPYIIIDQSTLCELPDWKSIINLMLEVAYEIK